MKTLTEILIIILFLLPNNTFAKGENDKISNYKIKFSKEENSGNSLHVRCEFDINIELVDTDCLEMKFGGQLKEHSVPDGSLIISSYPAIDYTYNYEQQKLTFIMNGQKYSHITMEYDYLSFSSAFIHRDVCEIWETSYSEYYYPFIFGEKSLFDVTIQTPDEYSVIGSYSLTEFDSTSTMKTYHYTTEYSVVSHSCIFAILPDSTYSHTIYNTNLFTVDFYLLKEIFVPDARINELIDITSSSIDFFSKYFGQYDNKYSGIENKMTYIFHKNEFSNRNNLNFISVSQYKFAEKPHILPLVHEIGHRWFGEWTLLIEDGNYGAYLIKESINEYLSFLFAKKHYGEDFFNSLIDSCQSQYNIIKDSGKDKSLYEMKFNNNNTVVYNKGTLIIHNIVKKMGEEQWLSFLKDFYLKYAGYPDLKYEDFIDLLCKKNEDCAVLLDNMIKDNIKL